MSEQGALFPVRRRRGVAVSMLGRTLLAWRREGMLAGDENAALRSALRALAEAVDLARTAALDGEGSAWAYSACAARYREALEAVARTGSASDDDLDELLVAITGGGAAAVRNAP